MASMICATPTWSGARTMASSVAKFTSADTSRICSRALRAVLAQLAQRRPVILKRCSVMPILRHSRSSVAGQSAGTNHTPPKPLRASQPANARMIVAVAATYRHQPNLLTEDWVTYPAQTRTSTSHPARVSRWQKPWQERYKPGHRATTPRAGQYQTHAVRCSQERADDSTGRHGARGVDHHARADGLARANRVDTIPSQSATDSPRHRATRAQRPKPGVPTDLANRRADQARCS